MFEATFDCSNDARKHQAVLHESDLSYQFWNKDASSTNTSEQKWRADYKAVAAPAVISFDDSNPGDHLISTSPFAPDDPPVTTKTELPALSSGGSAPAVGFYDAINPQWSNRFSSQLQQFQAPQVLLMESCRENTAPPSHSPVSQKERRLIEDCFHPRTNQDGFIQAGGFIGGLCGLSGWGFEQHLKSPTPEQKQKGGCENSTQRLSNSAEAVANLHKSIRQQIQSESQYNRLLNALKRQHAFARNELPGLLNKADVKAFIGTQEEMFAGKVAFAEGSESARQAGIFRDMANRNDPDAKKFLEEFQNSLEMKLKKAQSIQPLSQGELQLLEKKHAFLSDAANLKRPESLREVIGSMEEVKPGKKLFAEGSAEARALIEHAANLSKQQRLLSDFDPGRNDLVKTEKLMAGRAEKGAATWFDRMTLSAGRGLFAASGSLALGYGLDKYLCHNNPQLDGAHFISDGVLVPLILTSQMSARFKLPLAAVVMGGSRIGDLFNKQAGVAVYSSCMRPNWLDEAGSLAIAFSKWSFPKKAAAALGVVLGGRVYNSIAACNNWDGSKISRMNEEADTAFQRDQQEKTVDSFMNAVEKEKAIGLEADDALRLKWEDWWAKEKSMDREDFMRGTALVFDALGQARMELGSRLNPNNRDTANSRVLKGQNLDFGGEATQDLRTAAMELLNARNYAVSHPAVDHAAQSAYVKQLEELQSSVESNLDAIYGPHNMDAAFSELHRADFGDLLHSLARIRDRISVCNTSDRRHLAKLARDLALGDLVVASRPLSNDRNCKEAFKFLILSEELDPDAADNRPLRAIAEKVNDGYLYENRQ